MKIVKNEINNIDIDGIEPISSDNEQPDEQQQRSIIIKTNNSNYEKRR